VVRGEEIEAQERDKSILPAAAPHHDTDFVEHDVSVREHYTNDEGK
jgi:hypothetical protein